MSIQSRLVVIVLTAVFLGGCVDPGTSTQTATTDAPTSSIAATTPTSAAPTTSSTAAAAPNQAPTATINASVTNGSAPLEVVFSLDGSDPDGDALTWALDFDFDGMADENGTDLPRNVTHVFDAPGEYSVAFNVSDGELEGSASFSISVVEGLATVPEPIVYEGSAFVPDVLRLTEGECLFPLLAWAGLPTGGISGDVHSVPGEIIGWNYTLSSDDFVTMWVSADGSYAAEGVSGVVPEGAADVIVCSEAAVAADYVLTITHPAYLAPAPA